MKTLGIIGGIAPPSTIDYYRQLTARYRAASPDGHYPSILIDSIDATAFFALLEARDRPAMIAFLVGELGRLAAAGAELAIFASNSPHIVFDEVASASPIPLISIVEEAAKATASAGYRTVGLLGARFTMDAGFYPTVFARHGVSVVVPDDADRGYVHERYMTELVEATFRAETRAGMSAVVARMQRRDHIEAVVLGGTELPLLFRDGPPMVVPAIDTTLIHVEAAIRHLLA